MLRLLQDLRRRAYLARSARKSGVRHLRAFGSESVILPPATIRSPDRIEIGRRVLVAENVSFFLVEEHQGRAHSPRLRIGDDTVVSHGVWFSCVGEIEVGRDVLIGHNVLIADSFHEYEDRARPIIRQPMAPARRIVIEDGAIIGPGAAVLSGVTIGTGSYVAPNAVVAADVPPFSVAAGNPACVIRRWDEDADRYVDEQDPRLAGLLSAFTR